MNVYAFELRRQWKTALSWTLVLTGILWVMMRAVYPIYLASQEQVQAVLNRFPPEFAAVFALDLDQLFSFVGFYSFSFLYLSLCGAIMAAGLGLATFGREKRSKSTDFLLTKPRSRGSLFLSKMLADLTFLSVFYLCFCGSTLLLYQQTGETSPPLSWVWLAGSAMGLLQLFFWSLGMMLAVIAKKIRSASATAMAIGFAGFILLALNNLLEEEVLRFTSPLVYYAPLTALTTGSFDAPYAMTGLVLTVLFGLISYGLYCNADVHAV